MPATTFTQFPALRDATEGREAFLCHVPAEWLRRVVVANGVNGPPPDAERTAAWERALRGGTLPGPVPPIVLAVVTEATSPVRFANGRVRLPTSARLVVQSGRSVLAALGAAGDEGRTVAALLYVETDPARLDAAARLYARRGPLSRTRRVLAAGADDAGDPAAAVARELAAAPPFAGLTEMVKATLAPRSRHLFTLSAIYLATQALLNGRRAEPMETLFARARDFWQAAAAQFPEWDAVRRGTMTSGELRTRFLHAHGVVLHALGRAGAELLKTHPDDWRDRLRALAAVDWRRANAADWEGRALVGGKVAKTTPTVLLTASFLKARLGLALSDEEREKERRHAAPRPRS